MGVAGGAGGNANADGFFAHASSLCDPAGGAAYGTFSGMTKADLIEEVCHTGHLTRKESEAVIETVFESIVDSLRAGDKIEIRGFGSFRTRQRAARTGRNPKTGEPVAVPARRVPFFKPSKELKDGINAAVGAAGGAHQP